MDIKKEDLMALAYEVSERSYSPYSSFEVGAALLCLDGSVYLGTNVENVSFGATCCAERTAIFNAISNGKRDFVAIAIAAKQKNCYPCGICRQVMSEFCKKDFKVFVDGNDGVVEKRLDELLPNAFNF